jgi:hypothetical protein
MIWTNLLALQGRVRGFTLQFPPNLLLSGDTSIQDFAWRLPRFARIPNYQLREVDTMLTSEYRSAELATGRA